MASKPSPLDGPKKMAKWWGEWFALGDMTPCRPPAPLDLSQMTVDEEPEDGEGKHKPRTTTLSSPTSQGSEPEANTEEEKSLLEDAKSLKSKRKQSFSKAEGDVDGHWDGWVSKHVIG